MSPIIPVPTPVPTPVPEEEEFAEMPALLCGSCNFVHSKGGYLYEAEFPSELFGMCQCIQCENPDDQH